MGEAPNLPETHGLESTGPQETTPVETDGLPSGQQTQPEAAGLPAPTLSKLPLEYELEISPGNRVKVEIADVPERYFDSRHEMIDTPTLQPQTEAIRPAASMAEAIGSWSKQNAVVPITAKPTAAGGFLAPMGQKSRLYKRAMTFGWLIGVISATTILLLTALNR
jgi:hypothetical protein